LEITVLGCWAPYPRAGGACSGYLIRGGGQNILLEAGNGSLSRLMGFLDFRRLDAVIISHLHPDHYLDLFPLRHAIEGARRDGSRAGPLKLILPAMPVQKFQVLEGYKKAFETTPVEGLPLEQSLSGTPVRRLDLGKLSIRFVPAKHSLPGYAISFTGAGKLVFSGDTAWTEELVEIARGADLFLSEASGQDQDAGYLGDVHLTARQAGETARRAGVRQLLLTHFWPEYDPDLLVQQAGKSFDGPVLAVREGGTYRVVPGL
jgi:ribonuclease BN (tRNA processing enzyme)